MNCKKIIVAGIVIIGMMLSGVTQSWANEQVEAQHSPLLCVARERPFELRFKLLADEPIQEARVYFRNQEAEYFYFTLAHMEEDGEFLAVLPSPQATVSVLEYVLLLVDTNGTAVRSPLFALVVDEEQACRENRVKVMPQKLIVSSEHALEAEIGFYGEYIVWDLPKTSAETLYLSEAAEQLRVINGLFADLVEEQTSKEAEIPVGSAAKRGMSKKTVLGIGAAGAGAIALAGVAISGGGDDGGGGIWGGIDDVTAQVVSVLNKAPTVQNVCGTIVSNQLYVTNNAPEAVRLGTVDYEIILTMDSPSGSCRPGRLGSFAPGSKTILDPGETVLIREWSNDVNPCSGCPYLTAECVWESRYIVHTSLGSSVAKSSFSAQGDLCGGTAKTRAFDSRQQLCGSDAP